MACEPFYTPPPFKVCDVCGGECFWYGLAPHEHKDFETKGFIGNTQFLPYKNIEGFKPDVETGGKCGTYTCQRCHGTGRIPIYYTIEQWEELTGRKVPDDMPVWELFESKDFDKIYYFWKMTSYIKYRTKLNKKHKIVACVIATEAGEPPLDFCG